MSVTKYICHSKLAVSIAIQYNWKPGARYTNLRDIKYFPFLENYFLDINWKKYSFQRHLEIAELTKPSLTIARDIENIFQIDSILEEAILLKKYSKYVAIVPKDIRLQNRLEELIPKDFLLAYSVPTKYGGTSIPTSSFKRPVHLLGGRPDIQRKLASSMEVTSIDCNRFTIDAKFGKYFNGSGFSLHPEGGYLNCLRDSIKNINLIWEKYERGKYSFSLGA